MEEGKSFDKPFVPPRRDQDAEKPQREQKRSYHGEHGESTEVTEKNTGIFIVKTEEKIRR